MVLSIMLWRCFNSSGTFNLIKVEGMRNTEGYVKILKGNLKQSAVKLRFLRRFPKDLLQTTINDCMLLSSKKDTQLTISTRVNTFNPGSLWFFWNNLFSVSKANSCKHPIGCLEKLYLKKNTLFNSTWEIFEKSHIFFTPTENIYEIWKRNLFFQFFGWLMQYPLCTECKLCSFYQSKGQSK